MSDSPSASPSPAFEPAQDSVIAIRQEDDVTIQKPDDIALTILD